MSNPQKRENPSTPRKYSSAVAADANNCSDTFDNTTPHSNDDSNQGDILSLLLKSIGGTETLSPYGSDEDEGKQAIEQITERDKKYTELLGSFVNITRTRNIVKEIHKWLFFWIIVVACCAFGVLVFQTVSKIMSSEDTDYILSAIPIVITAFVSLITAIIGIPLAITHFLFNTKEDEYIVELIKHTQEHDSAGRNLLKDRLLEKYKLNKSGKVNRTPSRGQ